MDGSDLEPVKMPKSPRSPGGAQAAPSPRRPPAASPYKEDLDKAHMLAVLGSYKFENYLDQLYPEGYSTSPRSPSQAKAGRREAPGQPSPPAEPPTRAILGPDALVNGPKRKVRSHVAVQTDRSEFFDLRELLGTLDMTQGELAKLQSDVEDIEMRVKVDLVKKLDEELDKAHTTTLDRIQFLEGRQFRQLEQVRAAYQQHMANVIARLRYEQRLFQERLARDAEAKAAGERAALAARVEELTFQLRKTETIDGQLREKVVAQAITIEAQRREIEEGEHSKARRQQEKTIAEQAARIEAMGKAGEDERRRAARAHAEQAARHEAALAELRAAAAAAEQKHAETLARAEAEARRAAEAAERAWATERLKYEKAAAEAARENALQGILNSRQAAAMQRLAQENVALQEVISKLEKRISTLSSPAPWRTADEAGSAGPTPPQAYAMTAEKDALGFSQSWHSYKEYGAKTMASLGEFSATAWSSGEGRPRGGPRRSRGGEKPQVEAIVHEPGSAGSLGFASAAAPPAPVGLSTPELHVLNMATSGLPSVAQRPPPAPPLMPGGPTPPVQGKAPRGGRGRGPRDPNGVPLAARDLPPNFVSYDPAASSWGALSARGVPGHPAARRSTGTA